MGYLPKPPPQLYYPRAGVVREMAEEEHGRLLRECGFSLAPQVDCDSFRPFERHDQGHDPEHQHVTELSVNTPGLTPSIRTLPIDLAAMQPSLVSDLAWNMVAPAPVPVPRAADNILHASTRKDQATRIILRLHRYGRP
jgi:hypothetical protein